MHTVTMFEGTDTSEFPETPIYQIFSITDINSSSNVADGVDEDGSAMTEPSEPEGIFLSTQKSPDFPETNPNIIKAEESFYVTPHTKDYEGAVYDTLKTIESSCSIDFAAKCVSPNQDEILERIKDTLRQNVLTDSQSVRVSSFFGNSAIPIMRLSMMSGGGQSVDEESTNLRGSSIIKTRRLSAQRTKRALGDNHRDRHHQGRDNEESNSSDSHDASDSESEDGHRRHRHHGGRPDMSRPVEEDYLFMGSLGYGDTGDTCLYQNFETLAPSCQSSIADLHMLRSQYWREESMAREDMSRGFHHHPVLVIIYMVVCGIIAAIMYRRTSAILKNLRAVFTAIMANPSLKLQVETESGVVLPFEGMSAYTTPDISVWTNFWKRIRLFLTVYLLSCLIMMSSAIIVIVAEPENPRCVLYSAALIQVFLVIVYWRRRSAKMNGQAATAIPMGEVVTVSSTSSPGSGSTEVQSQGGNDLTKNTTPIEAFSVTTTTTDMSTGTSTSRSIVAAPGFFSSVINAFDSRHSHSAVDGSYSSLPNNESVHGMYSQPVIVRGVPVSTNVSTSTNTFQSGADTAPVLVVPRGSTNWI